VRIFGYDVNKMNARAWQEVRMPTYACADVEVLRSLQDLSRRLTGAMEELGKQFVRCIRESGLGYASVDFDDATGELWSQTEAAFYSALDSLHSGLNDSAAADELCLRFRGELEAAALAEFDRWCPLDSATPRTIRSLVVARYNLSQTMRGRSKSGKRLFELLRLPQLEPPIAKPARKSASTRRTTA
jgi:hypothetical protein